MKERENVIRSSSELSLGHVLEIGNLNDGINAAGFEIQELNPALENLDPPPKESLQLLVVSEDSLVHLPVLEDAVRVVADGVAAAVGAVHVGDDALQLLEPQILVEDAVGGEIAPPRQASEEHVGGVGDAEVAGAEELEEDDVAAEVVGGGGEEGNAPHGEVGGGGGEGLFELVEGFLLGGFEVGGEVGVFSVGRRAEGGGLHKGGDEGFLGGIWGGLRGLVFLEKEWGCGLH